MFLIVQFLHYHHLFNDGLAKKQTNIVTAKLINQTAMPSANISLKRAFLESLNSMTILHYKTTTKLHGVVFFLSS
jgi:hypothetical protein